ncbi:MAG: cell division protein ZapA [Deltaproteobacteria bacterium]|nr:cell division protein ZapA [Deltaproteobacteria bacterium]MBW2042549.1 cell division protein ZapA [Deltaproteobacteria bacterium]MBW2132640.1 cell division protein ZapA [Deltaproteobacteria bacterium]
MEQLVTIELFGQTYTFKSESETARAQEVVDFLVKEVTKVEEQLKTQTAHISKLAVLLLATLNIVNEYFEWKRTYTILLENITDRSDHLIQLLDENDPSGDFVILQPGTEP